MSSKAVTDGLKRVLADSYALYLKTQNYHWNVEGRHFKQLHELFQLEYEALALAIDEVAERIRTLGEKAPGSFAEFAKLKTIRDGDSSLGDNAMVKDLHDDNLAVAKLASAVVKAAQKTGDEVTIGLMVERAAAHEKAAWMLRSSLPTKAETAKKTVKGSKSSLRVVAKR